MVGRLVGIIDLCAVPFPSHASHAKHITSAGTASLMPCTSMASVGRAVMRSNRTGTAPSALLQVLAPSRLRVSWQPTRSTVGHSSWVKARPHLMLRHPLRRHCPGSTSQVCKLAFCFVLFCFVLFCFVAFCFVARHPLSGFWQQVLCMVLASSLTLLVLPGLVLASDAQHCQDVSYCYARAVNL